MSESNVSPEVVALAGRLLRCKASVKDTPHLKRLPVRLARLALSRTALGCDKRWVSKLHLESPVYDT
jgi:hypothetical protein